MNIKFCKRCGVSVYDGGDYCEKCKAEMEGRPYIEPAITSGVSFEENMDKNVESDIKENNINYAKNNKENKISLEKKLRIKKVQGGIFGNRINNTSNTSNLSGISSSNSSSDLTSDYCYAVLILGIVSLFYNCCFIPSIACIVFFVLSRKDNGISKLGHTEILLSRIGLGICIFGLIASLLYAVVFSGFIIFTNIFVGLLGG